MTYREKLERILVIMEEEKQKMKIEGEAYRASHAVLEKIKSLILK